MPFSPSSRYCFDTKIPSSAHSVCDSLHSIQHSFSCMESWKSTPFNSNKKQPPCPVQWIQSCILVQTIAVVYGFLMERAKNIQQFIGRSSPVQLFCLYYTSFLSVCQLVFRKIYEKIPRKMPANCASSINPHPLAPIATNDVEFTIAPFGVTMLLN